MRTLALAVVVLVLFCCRGSASALTPADDPRAYWGGVNNWAMGVLSGTAYASVCGESNPSAAAKMDTMVADDIGVARVAAYQSVATTTGGARTWTGLDNLLATASARGVKLALIVGNNWTDCDYLGTRPSYCGSTTAGKGCTGSTCGASWYDTGYTSVTDGYPVSYRDWLTEVVTRYSGHPAIYAWEVLNEPWGQCVHNFFADVTALIRSLDPVSDISLGGSESGGWSFMTENALPSVTLTTWHGYGHVTEPLPTALLNDLTIARALNKPLYVGENGISCNDDGVGCGTPCDETVRAGYFLTKMQAAYNAGAVGYMPWSWSPNLANGSCSFSYGNASPVMGLFAQVADSDGDGYKDQLEQATGKDPLTFCAVMRADVVQNGAVTIGDAIRVTEEIGTVPPQLWRDDQDGNRAITIADAVTVIGLVGKQVQLAC